MPRIELIPEDFDETSGDGSPTIDVCLDCADAEFDQYEADDVYPSKEHGLCTIGSTDVAHPPYEECDYNCELCGDPLTEKDD